MQNLNLNIDAFIDKINYYVIYIITFLKYVFNSIIAIKNVDFSLFNIPNSIGIICHFLFAIFCILIFITLLVFLGSIWNIIKTIIKWILYPFKLLFKLIKWIFSPKSELKQPIKTNNLNQYDLNKLQRKINDLEYKLNLQKRQNVIKPFENKYQKRG
ncbi:hypothetical protein AYWB_pII02 (plasmid) [Aster yellows witches'-broom phytoplasma AYWB]|uniref:Uncharacterized protein n=1 Tax=Aster yellows witches'-broom phytoplasma (strain AYWB) TaxID=322098 RepID=Q2NIE8_AYWBP|nr:hypothetical protein [Aster yellows witches'-broom phytoplasma]ABC65795.1 hypothetical protein AYWB_pII02 [Aster yellows witches'-broom phytoplasma AYWB]